MLLRQRNEWSPSTVLKGSEPASTMRDRSAPATSSGTSAPFGSTTMFAPYWRTVRLSRSPRTSDTLASATAMPTPIATASTATANRFGRRAMDWNSARRNMSALALRDHALVVDRRGVDLQLIAYDGRVHRNRIAAARLPERGQVDRRAAVPAVETVRVLVVAEVAADLARVHARLHRAVRLLDREEPQGRVGVLGIGHFEEVDLPVVHGCQRQGDRTVLRR